MEDMPKFVIIITVALIVLAVGVTAFLTMLSPLNLEKSYTQTYNVTDPTVTQVCTLQFTPESNTVTVEQFNGVSWNNVASTWYGVSGKRVTVLPGGMQG